MDNRILRGLIYGFSGLILLFAALMALNYAGSFLGGGALSSGQEERRPGAAETAAQAAMAAARAGGTSPGSGLPSMRQGLSTASVHADGGIMLVKEKEFSGVAEKPKGMMEQLSELSGGDKSKPAPVRMKDSDLEKKVDLGGNPGKEPSLSSSAMPELGRRPGQEGVTLLRAPVDYKLFRSSTTWTAFTSSRKCRAEPEAVSALKPAPSSFGSPDFSKDLVVVLVSLSDLPNGIFRIVKVEKSGGELVVSYRVDPLAMSASAKQDRHDYYSGTVIPAGLKVRLSQVP